MVHQEKLSKTTFIFFLLSSLFMAEDMNMKILKAFAEIGQPAKAKDVAEKLGIQTSKVSCRLAPLKKKGLLDSPEKGVYVITEEGKKLVQ